MMPSAYACVVSDPETNLQRKFHSDLLWLRSRNKKAKLVFYWRGWAGIFLVFYYKITLKRK